MAEILLMEAAREGDLEKVRTLLIDGIDVNEETESGFIALIYAALHGHLEIASLLIEHGARIDHQDNDGFTTLHYASANNRIALVSLLIEKGADLNIKNMDEETALMHSAFWGHFSISSLLLKNGADVSLVNMQGKTALDWARARNKLDCVAILENYERFHRFRKVWLSFSTSLSSFQDNQIQESKQSFIQSPSMRRVMDSSDLVRYLTEFM